MAARNLCSHMPSASATTGSLRNRKGGSAGVSWPRSNASRHSSAIPRSAMRSSSGLSGRGCWRRMAAASARCQWASAETVVGVPWPGCGLVALVLVMAASLLGGGQAGWTGIAEQIDTGTLEEGAWLPSERDLATTYQADRSTVRRALRILQARGLIALQRGVGAQVGEPVRRNAADVTRR